MPQNAFAVQAPLVELTALPRRPSRIWGREQGRGMKQERKEGKRKLEDGGMEFGNYAGE